MKEKTEKRLNSENQRQNLCEFSYVFLYGSYLEIHFL